ncbi:cellulose biosynthesis cyclic di-GMP-binding regulatory protein BcsB [uncultured Sutterella sp.]|uniref:cellulose biosynthesis cyclic di-GMP-binding regulatory protein BcsB n=1 Tax=uncultured Sutterella sp. TaxID=286133 RepID=UPI00260BC961|nr:cellulose biosynthesis cyclic di-GMP-binding regulatory protein BcsB [uncultured Sutterella sp.]
MKMKTFIFPLIASLFVQGACWSTACAAEGPEQKGAAPAPDEMTSFAEALARPRDSRAEAIPPKTELLPLASLASGGPSPSIRLTGIWPRQTFEFVMRRDEIITASELTLYWTPSPALIPIRSQLIVRLNGQVQKVLPITREMLGTKNQSVVPLDPKKLKDANVLELEFIGEYDNVCTTPTSPTLWLTVDDASQLSLSRQKIRVADDLSLFPAPFVDPHDKSMMRVGFAFSSAPSEGELSAAAVLASYFGAEADWRGADFPSYFNLIPPEGHFVAFYTSERHPEFLKDWPEPQGPEVAIADAPLSPWAKMLVIAGRNDAELMDAARAAASGSVLLSGSRSRIREAVQLAARKPYDAPKWIDTTHATTFGELAEYPGALTTRGAEPWPVHLTLRLPPDLFVVNRSSVPVHLRYRYTLPEPNSQAQLRFRVNNTLVEAQRLTDQGSSETVNRVAVVDSIASMFEMLDIPTILFDAVNTLEFDFRYSLSIYAGTPENCRTVTLIDQQCEIDPRSTIDFSGFYHYAELPDLKLFAQSGFPFTRMADFSDTVFAFSGAPTPAEAETLLNASGRLGSLTGAVGFRADVRIDPKPESLADKDILLIGRLPKSVLEGPDEEKPALLIDALSRELLTARGIPGMNPEKRKLSAPEERFSVLAAGTLAALTGFESPITSGRSVVALLAADPTGSERLSASLADPSKLLDSAGSVSFIRENGALNFYTAPGYTVGSLPWHQHVWYVMLEHPFLLILCALGCAILIGCLIYALMRIRIRSRLSEGGSR